MRSRLCMYPVAFNWRIPASTNGYPVRPSHQAEKRAEEYSQAMFVYSGLKGLFMLCKGRGCQLFIWIIFRDM